MQRAVWALAVLLILAAPRGEAATVVKIKVKKRPSLEPEGLENRLEGTLKTIAGYHGTDRRWDHGGNLQRHKARFESKVRAEYQRILQTLSKRYGRRFHKNTDATDLFAAIDATFQSASQRILAKGVVLAYGALQVRSIDKWKSVDVEKAVASLHRGVEGAKILRIVMPEESDPVKNLMSESDVNEILAAYDPGAVEQKVWRKIQRLSEALAKETMGQPRRQRGR